MHGKSSSRDIGISARNVTLSLGAKGAQTEILNGIDLDIPGGESLAILGPSGSGKSSLMAILAGLERATSGQVSVAGVDYGPLDEDALARARRGTIGIVLQSFHLLPTMSALENVAVPLELAGRADAFAGSQFRDSRRIEWGVTHDRETVGKPDKRDERDWRGVEEAKGQRAGGADQQ